MVLLLLDRGISVMQEEVEVLLVAEVLLLLLVAVVLE